MQNVTTQLLLADWRLQRAHLDREIAFQEGDLHGPDAKVLDELRGLAAELDRLIEGCRGEQTETRH
jgi:hypothetical protein